MKIHFIGIGGIGISGLAQYMHFRGHKVTGSDISDSLITKKLCDLGIKVSVGHNKSAIIDQDLVVHSAIIRPDNPEVVASKSKGIEVLARREALPMILADRKVYSVAGAHGKSTTTAILTAIMQGSAIIGAEAKSFGSNVRYDETTDMYICPEGKFLRNVGKFFNKKRRVYMTIYKGSDCSSCPHQKECCKRIWWRYQ